jgi:hypothetical protein
MATLLITHDVDDVAHWVSSPKRAELFSRLGITVRVFTDPTGGKRTGLVVDVPDMSVFDAAMASPEAAESMKYDGVHPETMLLLVEA